MKLHCIAFGKLKHPAYKALAEEYRTRISPWMPLSEAELKPHFERPQARKIEHAAFLAELAKQSRPRPTIVLDASGPSWTTRQWADRLNAHGFEINLAIGSTWGWDPEWLANPSVIKVSFGKQTLAHELARVVAYEQVYRALCLLRNHPYHVENSATVLT